MKLTVIGGTGLIGSQVSRERRRPTQLRHKQPPIEWMSADRNCRVAKSQDMQPRRGIRGVLGQSGSRAPFQTAGPPPRSARSLMSRSIRCVIKKLTAATGSTSNGAHRREYAYRSRTSSRVVPPGSSRRAKAQVKS
jgi:hypothetical protein